jgi:hypothetical protein
MTDEAADLRHDYVAIAAEQAARIVELESALHDIHSITYMSGDKVLHTICARAANGLGFDALKRRRDQ